MWQLSVTERPKNAVFWLFHCHCESSSLSRGNKNHVILPCLYVTYCNCVCLLLTECLKTNLDILSVQRAGDVPCDHRWICSNWSLETPLLPHMRTRRPVQVCPLGDSPTSRPTRPVQTCPLLSPYIYRQAGGWPSTECPSCLKCRCSSMHCSNPNWRWEICFTTDISAW